jgi:ubiquinone/menaquinone biosynthesis C-methylase UbiE
MTSTEWKKFWEEREGLSDFEFDRGRSATDSAIESMSLQELLEFIDPRRTDVVFDAGCGSGTSALLVQPRVHRVLGMDYSGDAVDRCRRRIVDGGVPNVSVIQGEMSRIPLPDGSVDKVLCLSVLQYLSDTEVRRALAEAARILKDGGLIVLHVKNLSSLYLSSLWLAKKVKRALGRTTKMEHVRGYRWYVRELRAVGAEVVGYNSFNVFVLDALPRVLVERIRKAELRHRDHFPMRSGFLRRHGADLKIKARVRKAG